MNIVELARSPVRKERSRESAFWVYNTTRSCTIIAYAGKNGQLTDVGHVLELAKVRKKVHDNGNYDGPDEGALAAEYASQRAV